ncbi:MAG: hypothetical protein CL567_01210 [Alphaproteobacteria bacterium]|nr:hypothetical protein [Alphaproteobacteria bacterium]|tara:strand:- start:86 stop:1021 length:936 start_codon:yes stop_codon:yes gene_type:complete
MPARNLIAIGAGLTSALLFAAITTGHPLAMLVVPFSMLPLFLIGLSSGVTTTIISLVVATIVVASICGFIGGIIYVAAEAVPAFAISKHLKSFNNKGNNQYSRAPASKLISYITGYASILLILIFVSSLGLEGGFIGMVERQLNMALEPLISNNLNSEESIKNLASQIARLAPGTMTAWWLAITLISLGISQALLKRFSNIYVFNLNLAYAKNPYWIVFGLAISLVIGLISDGLAGIIGWNLFQVLIVPFIFVGLMVIHLLCKGWAPGPLFIGVFYLIMFVRGWPMFLVAILGFFEQWVKLRDRLGAANST